MALMMAKASGCAIALLFAGNALAMGLGEASGKAVLGQPLRLEIPILGSGGAVPAKSCFRVHGPRAEVGNEFAARNARIEIVGQGAGAKLLVTTTAAVTEPVIGFTVEAACDIGLSREYVLLVGLPTATPVAPVVTASTRAAAPAPQERPASLPEKDIASDVLHVSKPLTLEALAQQKYPLQPKAREKFIRMMAAANPALSSGETLIAAGTALRLPSGLPQRRVGPYHGEAAVPARPTKAPSAEAVAQVPAQSGKPQARPAKGGKDRLVLGAAAESSEAKMLAEAERLTAILVEQNKTQDALTENVAKLEASYTDLHKQFLEMQTKLARVEAERAAEKQAAENSKSSQIIELLVAVLGGGAVGGIALHLFQRQRAQQRLSAETQHIDEEEAAVPLRAPVAHTPKVAAPAAALAPAVPPWLTKAAPAVDAVEAPDATPQMPSQPVVAAAAAPAAVLESPVAVAPIEPVSQALDVPAAPSVPPAVQTEPIEPAPVFEPLDFAPVSLTPQETALAPTPPAEAAVEVQEAVAQEPLALDFPEISLPAVEQGKTLDFHKP